MRRKKSEESKKIGNNQKNPVKKKSKVPFFLYICTHLQHPSLGCFLNTKHTHTKEEESGEKRCGVKKKETHTHKSCVLLLMEEEDDVIDFLVAELGSNHKDDLGKQEDNNGETAVVEEQREGWGSLDKQTAKTTLSKEEYKKWKKMVKKKRKEGEEATGGKSKKKHRNKDKEADGMDEDHGDLVKGKGRGLRSKKQSKKSGETVAAPRRKRGRQEDAKIEGETHIDSNATLVVTRLQRTGTPKAKETKQQRLSRYLQAANSLVYRMGEARRADTNARATRREAPLHRFVLREQVLESAQNLTLHEALVEAGFLEELSYWLYDPSTNELGPLDLRTHALDLLLRFRYHGLATVRHQPGKTSLKFDDVASYEGIEKEHLLRTNLGEAVNKVRNNPKEVPSNRNKALMLIERFIRVLSGEEEEEAAKYETKWPSMGNPLVADPFVYVPSHSEAFLRRFAVADPLDPTSYLRVPPPRPSRPIIR